MARYLIDTPDGKTIPIEGPDDATDEELIGIAQKHLSSIAKPAGKTKPPASPTGDLSLPADKRSREMPDLGTSEELIAEMKKGDETTRAAAPEASKVIQQAGSAPPAKGSINDKLAEGDIASAYGSLSDVEKFGAGVGVPVLAYGGYKLGQKVFGEEKTEKPSTRIEPTSAPPSTPPETPPPSNIKSRTFEAGNYGEQNIKTTMSPKETQIAAEIKNKYGYDWGDIKTKFGLADVPINDMTQAEMLVNNVRNQEAAAAEAPKAPVAETPPPAPVEEIKPAPVAETPKAPAPPPEAAPKAAVPPTEEKLTKQQKGMKGHLVSMYGGGPEGEAAYGKVKEILGYTPEYPPGKGGSLSAQETQILKDWRKANMAGPKINLTHDMKKAMTSGGTLAVLMSIPAFAEAAQKKDYGEMTNIATDLLVLPFAQSRPTGENEQYELAKRRYEGLVGGGRGVTPAQAYNVGAGRGIAPPSAYQR